MRILTVDDDADDNKTLSLEFLIIDLKFWEGELSFHSFPPLATSLNMVVVDMAVIVSYTWSYVVV